MQRRNVIWGSRQKSLEYVISHRPLIYIGSRINTQSKPTIHAYILSVVLTWNFAKLISLIENTKL